LSDSTDRLVVKLSNFFTTAYCKLRGALAPVAYALGGTEI